MSEFAALRRGSLSKEEVAGLVVAVAAHVALVAWLTLKPPVVAPFPVPERMTVTFSEDVASKSTSPEPQAEAAPPPRRSRLWPFVFGFIFGAAALFGLAVLAALRSW